MNRQLFLEMFSSLGFKDTTLSWFSNLPGCLFFSHLCWVILYSPLNVEVHQNSGHLTLFHIMASVITCRPTTSKFYTVSLAQTSSLSSRLVYCIAYSTYKTSLNSTLSFHNCFSSSVPDFLHIRSWPSQLFKIDTWSQASLFSPFMYHNQSSSKFYLQICLTY